jgi:hypothetical protein
MNVSRKCLNMLAIMAALVIMAVFSGANPCQAQEVIMDEDVEDTYESSKGPNMRHYGHIFVGFGMVPDFGEVQGAATDISGSRDFLFGYRYKLKILSFYALGFEAYVKPTRFALSDDGANPPIASNPLTLAENEKRHMLKNNAAGAGVYQRINVGRRGNSLGNYLDIGVHGNWNYLVKEVVVFKGNSIYPAAQDSRNVYRKLDYYNPFNYGLSARLGIGQYSIYADYRISDYFNTNYLIPELPRVTIGFQYAVK